MVARGNQWSVGGSGNSPKRVIIAAYKHASGDGYSSEVVLGKLIDRFGTQAVMNRPYLSAREINLIFGAELIHDAYVIRNKSDNWAEFAKEHKVAAQRLAKAEILALEGDDVSR